MKKIAVIGPESTGKTTLAVQLSDHYGEKHVPEFAREYIDQLNRPYQKSDIEIIARKQLDLEDTVSREAKNYLFCDTNLLVIKIWMEDKFDHCPAWIIEAMQERKYDLHLLTGPDIPWNKDQQREDPGRRNFLFELYKKNLEKYHLTYRVVRGMYEERYRNAKNAVTEYFRER